MKNAKPYLLLRVFQIIKANAAKQGNPPDLKRKDLTSWTNGLQIPAKGETVLHTGCEYQMTAYTQSLVGVLKRVKFEDGPKRRCLDSLAWQLELPTQVGCTAPGAAHKASLGGRISRG